MKKNNKSKRARKEAAKRATATLESIIETRTQEIDRSLQILDEEEEYLRKRIEVINENLEKIKRARNRNRQEKDSLEKKRDKVLQPPAEPRGDQQKMLLDQLNEAIKSQMARNQAASAMPSEMSGQPREIQKIILDKMNKAIKNNLLAEQAQATSAAGGSDNKINITNLWATFMVPRNVEEISGSEDEATLDEAAGGSYLNDDPDSTN